MKYRLGDIADIQAGYQFRGRVVPDPGGGVPVIQMKDFSPAYGIDVGGMVTVSMANIPPACMAKAGDVLFLARGQRLTATVVRPEVEGAIVSGYFFILRTDLRMVDPGFLAWYINQPAFQEQLRAVAKGTDTPLVSKTDIQGLTVDLPQKSTQALIARLDELSRSERRLLETIAEKRTVLIRALTQVAARSGNGHEGNRK
jgi:restriction endonuclease S subunit